MFLNMASTLDLSDPRALSRAYDDHSRGVYAAAFRILGNGAQAEDVVQDVFLRLWRRPHTFDARRGEPSGAFTQLVAAISVGVVDGEVLLDLEYSEDSRAEVDLNVVAVESGGLIEVQGTAERAPFTRDQLGQMMDLAAPAIDRLVAAQRAVLR